MRILHCRFAFSLLEYSHALRRQKLTENIKIPTSDYNDPPGDDKASPE